MKESNHDRRGAARAHLTIIRKQREQQHRESAVFIKLAYAYGVTVPEIVIETGISQPEVQKILLG